MKQKIWNLIIIGLLTVIITSCRIDHIDSDEIIAEKIEFPTIEFTLAPSTDTTIFGPQGTRIFIGSETLQFADGRPATDSIKIELKEFYKKSDIILADLSTISGDRLLETGGMIYIDASSNGQKLEIKPDKRIVVHFPKERNDYHNMNLFYADQSATDTSVTNWEIDTIKLVKTTVQLGMYGYTWLSPDDSTNFEYIPKNFTDTGYYWSPLDLYVNQFDFSEKIKDEINNQSEYVEVEFTLSTQGKVINPKVVDNVSKETKNEIIQFMRGLPEFKPCKDKYGTISKLEGRIGILGGNIIPIYKSDEKYISSFDKKYSRFENKPIKNMNDAELNYYVFSVSKLGWINCDRFIDIEETIDVLAQLPVDSNTKLKMAFSDIDGVLMADIVDDKFVFSKVPKGRKVTIIGIKNENGRLLTVFKETTLSDQPIYDLCFMETTLVELKAKLEKI